MFAIEWSQGIEDAWAEVAAFVPKLVGAIVVFLIGWIVAKIIRRVIVKVLNAINFDTYVDKAGIGAPLERGGYPSSVDLIGKIIYFALMLLVLQLSVGVFGETAVSGAIDEMVAFIPRLIVALVIIVITGVVANAVRDLMAPAVEHLSAGDLLKNAAFFAIWLIGGFAALDQLQVAKDVVDVLFQTIMYSLGFIIAVSFGVGGIWAARDRFWPAVYDRISSDVSSSANAAPASANADD
jgi:flagellar biosynthesis protein FliQ